MPETCDGFCTIEEALDELRAGRMVVLVDDEHRENEGDLVLAAEKVTPDGINFMVHHARGIVCLSMDAAICARLPLEAVGDAELGPNSTPFTPAIDARTG